MRVRTLTSAGVAVAAHLLLIGALALGIRVAQAPNETPAMVVTLTRLFAPRTQRPPPPAPPTPNRLSPPVAAPQAAPAPTAPPPVALPENGPIDPRLAAADAVRNALRGVVRCAHPELYNLDEAERTACLRRNRELAAGAPTYTVDPADHARHDPPVASHGMAAKSHLSPRPGNPLAPPAQCEHLWCENSNIQPGPNIY